MTTIAWDGSTLSADRKCSIPGHGFRSQKIYRLKNGELFAYCGESAVAMQLLDWLDNDRDPQTYPHAMVEPEAVTEGLLIDGKKKIWLYERTARPIPVKEKFFAIGSGAAYALAAMHLGKSSEMAVKVATKFDPGSGLGVDTLKFGGKI